MACGYKRQAEMERPADIIAIQLKSQPAAGNHGGKAYEPGKTDRQRHSQEPPLPGKREDQEEEKRERGV